MRHEKLQSDKIDIKDANAMLCMKEKGLDSYIQCFHIRLLFAH